MMYGIEKKVSVKGTLSKHSKRTVVRLKFLLSCYIDVTKMF